MDIFVRRALQEEFEYMKWADTWESDCTTFDYCYETDETCLITKGSATVKYDGKEVSFGEGDLVVFPKGLKCTWIVHTPIKKFLRN